jgi:hypothetical protein
LTAEGDAVASRGTTFAKQDRDRAKKAKAAEKRERREAKDAEDAAQSDTEPDTVEVGDDLSAAALLRLVEELHEGFADGRISFEDFEARKIELMEKLSVS